MIIFSLIEYFIIKYFKYLIIIYAPNENRTHYLQFTRLVPHHYGPRSLDINRYYSIDILTIDNLFKSFLQLNNYSLKILIKRIKNNLFY